MVSFSQLTTVKKDTIFGAAQTKLGLSYFVRALRSFCLLYAGEEMDYDPLLRLRSCLSVFSDTEKTESTANCPMVFDSWSCWNSTAPGTVQEQPCPNFVLGFSPKSEFFCL